MKPIAGNTTTLRLKVCRALFGIALSSAAFGLSGCDEAEPEGVRYSNSPVTVATRFFPGSITSEHNEFDLALMPDGQRIYFTRRIEGEVQKILYSDFDGTTWSDPVLAPFSTDRDETPAVSPDGRYMHFGSQREIPGRPNLGGFDMNVWRMERTEAGWSEPVPLPAPLNLVQAEGENWPIAQNNLMSTIDGETYIFGTMNPGAPGIQAYTTTFDGSDYSEPELIEGLFEDPSTWIYSPILSPDGRYLFFNTYEAPDGIGGEDIYVSQRTESGWSRAVNLGPVVNSEGEEGSPRFSPDGYYFFFVHADNLGDDEYGSWDIHYIETEYLELESLFDSR